ncbi:MAG: tetratricopeptide repeat protein [Syntrophomonadaceae bacterium]|nr:tetratricopeptide repeat protein [Syntrophomonadaceae bacterium]
MKADDKHIDFLELAAAKMEAHEISAALAVLNDHADEADVKWLEMAGECCFLLGDFEQAVTWWEQARESKTASSAVLKRLAEVKKPSFQFWIKRFDEAIDQMERKNYAAALDILQELKLERDGFVSLYQLLGLCYLANGDRVRAQQAWNKGLAIDSSNEKLLGYLAATTSFERSTLPQAPESFRFGSKQKKDRKPWQLIAGAACLMLLLGGVAWYNNALPAFSRQQVKVPAEGLFGNEDISPAAQVEQEMAAAKLSGPPAVGEDEMGGSFYDQEQERFYYEKGLNAYLRSDFKTAANNLGMVVAMGSQDYLHREAQYYLARIAFLQKDYQRAERLYNDYLNLFPNSNYYDDSLFYLGWVYYEMGQVDKTRECFQRLKDLEQPVGYQTTALYQRIMNS